MEDDKVLSDTASVWNVQLGDEDEWHKMTHQKEAQTQTDACCYTEEADLILCRLDRLEQLLTQRPLWRIICGIWDWIR